METLVLANLSIAFNFYLISAELGDAYSQYEVGRCYLIGKGVAKDELLAARWFTRADERCEQMRKI